MKLQTMATTAIMMTFTLLALETTVTAMDVDDLESSRKIDWSRGREPSLQNNGSTAVILSPSPRAVIRSRVQTLDRIPIQIHCRAAEPVPDAFWVWSSAPIGEHPPSASRQGRCWICNDGG